MNRLEIKDLKYSYEEADNERTYVLKGINAKFTSGKLYSIVGESGSGKTTFISLLSGLDELQEGDIIYNDKSLSNIGTQKYRLNYVNIVFQSYNLINYMTAKENVEVAIDFGGKEVDDKYVYKTLASVGINEAKANRTVLKLSGGEQQRVAIARALASDVPIIVADEPTGNLDEDTEKKVMDIFKKMADDGKIVIIVTHSSNVSKYADVVYKLKKGNLEVK